MALPLPDLLPVFNAQPGATLLLSADWVILGASDDYLAATLTERATLVGQHIFAAFPDNPDAPEANAVANVRASLEAVLATKQPHDMAPQHYDVPDPARPGHFVERHWKPRHTPVLDATGQVQCIIQSVQDITAARLTDRLLQESQVGEQLARADADAQRQRFHDVLMQLPAYIAVYHGPEHVYQFVNPPYQSMFPHRTFAGRPFREGISEATALGVVALFDRVYETGEPYYAREMEGWFDFRGTGEPEQVFLNLSLYPLFDADGNVDGVLDYSYNVTEQVRARRQVEQLNQDLEARVQARTEEALALQADLLAAGQHQADLRARLYQVFEQTPACIALLRGPAHRFEYVNKAYQDLFLGRELVGQAVRAAAPELVAQGFVALLDEVYRSGETYFGQELTFTPQPAPGQEAPRTAYFNFTYQAYREDGAVAGVSIFAYDVTEQVLARQEREAERRLLTDVFAQAPAGIWVVRGPDYVFEVINPAMTHIIGCSAEQALGRPYFEVLPELTSQGLPELLRRVWEQGESVFAEELAVRLAYHAPEEVGYFTFVFQPLRDEHGHVARISCVALDVTSQVKARREVETSEQQVRALVESAPFPIGVYVGEDLRIQLANETMLTTWGKGSNVIGRRYADVLPELADQAVFEQLHHVRTSGEPLHLRNQQLELVMGGVPQVFHFNYSFTPLRDAEGAVYGVLNTAADVTDLVVARQRLESYAGELQESEARFRTMADAAPNMVWAVHPDSSIRYINRAFLDFVGLDNEQQYIATGWGPYLHPDELELTQRTLSRAIAQREPYVLEHRMRRSDGHYRWLLAQGAPSYLAGGELYGYVGSAIDITELKQTNEQLTRTNVDLDNFIYTASHDLKAPISNIEGLLYLLQEELPPAVAQDAEIGPTLTRMLEAVERFKRTIHHLTEVSKLQKEHGSATTLANLAGIIEGVRQDLAPLLQATGARIAVDVAALPPVQFSEKNLRSVVYNLLSNALKYHSPDRTPHIDVRGHVRAGHTVLEVHDNGLGMTESQLAKLFGMFQRFHDHVEGTGIGLYMVKRMVDNAGGRIEAHSQPGAGTTFFVYLPHATSANGAPFPAILPS